MYLYIFEGGEMAQSEQPPTDLDTDSIDDGILQVLTVDTTRPFIEFVAGAGAQRVPEADRMIDDHEHDFTVPPMSDETVEKLGWRRDK